MVCTALCLLILVPSAFAESQALNFAGLAGSLQNSSHANISNGLKTFKNSPLILMEMDPIGIKTPPLNVIEGEVTDPNFNVMRNEATKKSTAIAWVVGCLVVATIVPLATWWYFSR